MENEPQRVSGAAQGLPHSPTHGDPAWGSPFSALSLIPEHPTHIPNPRRVRHPALALHTGQRVVAGSEGDRRAHPCPLEEPNPLAAPGTDTNTPKSHKPHGAFISKHPKSHLPKTSPPAQQGPSNLCSLENQQILKQPVYPGTRG